MPDPAETTLALLTDVLGPTPDFSVRLWDGRRLGPQDERCTLVLTHPGALRAFLWPPTQLNMAEAYVRGDIEIEGDVHGVFELADALLVEHRWGLMQRLSLARRLLSLPAERRPSAGREPARLRGRRFSRARDREAVTYHYDRRTSSSRASSTSGWSTRARTSSLRTTTSTRHKSRSSISCVESSGFARASGCSISAAAGAR